MVCYKIPPNKLSSGIVFNSVGDDPQPSATERGSERERERERERKREKERFRERERVRYIERDREI